MILPKELTTTIATLKTVLYNDRRYFLRSVYRSEIYLYLKKHETSKGEFMQGWLATLTAKKVLPIWEEEHKTQPEPHLDSSYPQKWLFLAEGVLTNTVDRTKARSRAEQDLSLWKLNRRESKEWHTPGADNAALAALSSLFEATGKNPFEEIELKGTEDELIDPYKSKGGDAALYACDAYGGEFQEFDKYKSLEFWEWWLTEAIPQAWDLAWLLDLDEYSLK